MRAEPKLLATTALVSNFPDKWVCNELHWIGMNPSGSGGRLALVNRNLLGDSAAKKMAISTYKTQPIWYPLTTTERRGYSMITQGVSKYSLESIWKWDDAAVARKRFPHNYQFIRGIRRSIPLFVLRLKKLLCKHLRCRWLETAYRSCDVVVKLRFHFRRSGSNPCLCVFFFNNTLFGIELGSRSVEILHKVSDKASNVKSVMCILIIFSLSPLIYTKIPTDHISRGSYSSMNWKSPKLAGKSKYGPVPFCELINWKIIRFFLLVLYRGRSCRGAKSRGVCSKSQVASNIW